MHFIVAATAANRLVCEDRPRGAGP